MPATEFQFRGQYTYSSSDSLRLGQPCRNQAFSMPIFITGRSPRLQTALSPQTESILRHPQYRLIRNVVIHRMLYGNSWSSPRSVRVKPLYWELDDSRQPDYLCFGSGFLPYRLRIIKAVWSSIYCLKNLHDYRYDVRAVTKRGLRNRVIYVRKSLPKDSTLD